MFKSDLMSSVSQMFEFQQYKIIKLVSNQFLEMYIKHSDIFQKSKITIFEKLLLRVGSFLTNNVQLYLKDSPDSRVRSIAFGLAAEEPTSLNACITIS